MVAIVPPAAVGTRRRTARPGRVLPRSCPGSRSRTSADPFHRRSPGSRVALVVGLAAVAATLHVAAAGGPGRRRAVSRIHRITALDDRRVRRRGPGEMNDVQPAAPCPSFVKLWRIRRRRSSTRSVDWAELIARSEPIADASLPDMRARSRPGTAIAAMIPMIATTISSSIRVKPFACASSFLLPPDKLSQRYQPVACFSML